jgi:hypothetical protein
MNAFLETPAGERHVLRILTNNRRALGGVFGG